MKKGWVICVTDRTETDQAFKLELKSRTDVREKTSNLQERYNALEANRFSVNGTCPYSEVAIEKRIRVRFRFTDLELLEVMALIAMTDPLLISSEETSAIVEIDECFSDQITTILAKHDVEVDQNIIV